MLKSPRQFSLTGSFLASDHVHLVLFGYLAITYSLTNLCFATSHFSLLPNKHTTLFKKVFKIMQLGTKLNENFSVLPVFLLSTHL